MTRRRHKVVRLSATLRGMHRRANCTLELWKETSATGAEVLRAAITHAPADLPDGLYTIMLGGETLVAQRQRGAWLFTLLPHGIVLGESPRAA
ncbi:MAG TPA: hypothetical protein VFJ10_08570 [Acidobacteriaceae bacterium]|nr:hypothetical protein [Acidobacteriaceae bacterium]